MNDAFKPQSRALAASLIAAGIALFAASGAASAATWSSTATRATAVSDLTPVGRAPASAPLHLVIGLEIQNRSEFNTFFTHLTTYGDPAFGKTISNASFVSQYSPTEKQVQKVVDFLTRSGFGNVQVAGNRLVVTADASVADAERAFNTQLSQYRVDGELLYANTRGAQVPSSLGGLVMYVGGLQNIFKAKTMNTQSHGQSRNQGPVTEANVSYLPTQFAHLYGADGTPTAATQVAGIISEGNLDQTLIDFGLFLTANSLSVPVDVIYVEPKGTDTSGTPEWDIDSQSIVGMGGGLGHLYFYAVASLSNSDLVVDYNRAVSDDLATSINVSLGECESGTFGDGTMAMSDEIFQAGIAQGQTFFVSSGDSGSQQCGNRKPAGVSSPASSPYVVAVGGTSLYATGAGDYSSETAWSGSGGGTSVYETAPSWQASVNSSGYRTVPDIAADADPATGEKIYLNGATGVYGGTSLASPLSAGASLRIWSYFGAPTYFLAPLIYAYTPAYSESAHDIISGSNGAYIAGLGYDLVTGLGTWNIYCDIFSCNPN